MPSLKPTVGLPRPVRTTCSRPCASYHLVTRHSTSDLPECEGGYVPDGVISPAAPRLRLKALAAFDPKFDPKAIELKRTYTNQFVEKAPK